MSSSRGHSSTESIDRDPFVVFFIPQRCNPPRSAFAKRCKFHETCRFAHTDTELRNHPMQYKEYPCNDPFGCRWGSRCHSYHSEKERIEYDPRRLRWLLRWQVELDTMPAATGFKAYRSEQIERVYARARDGQSVSAASSLFRAVVGKGVGEEVPAGHDVMEEKEMVDSVLAPAAAMTPQLSGSTPAGGSLGWSEKKAARRKKATNQDESCGGGDGDCDGGGSMCPICSNVIRVTDAIQMKLHVDDCLNRMIAGDGGDGDGDGDDEESVSEEEDDSEEDEEDESEDETDEVAVVVEEADITATVTDAAITAASTAAAAISGAATAAVTAAFAAATVTAAATATITAAATATVTAAAAATVAAMNKKEAPPGTRECVSCGEFLDSSLFSKKQLSRNATTRRCRQCVEATTETTSDLLQRQQERSTKKNARRHKNEKKKKRKKKEEQSGCDVMTLESFAFPCCACGREFTSAKYLSIDSRCEIISGDATDYANLYCRSCPNPYACETDSDDSDDDEGQPMTAAEKEQDDLETAHCLAEWSGDGLRCSLCPFFKNKHRFSPHYLSLPASERRCKHCVRQVALKENAKAEGVADQVTYPGAPHFHRCVVCQTPRSAFEVSVFEHGITCLWCVIRLERARAKRANGDYSNPSDSSSESSDSDDYDSDKEGVEMDDEINFDEILRLSTKLYREDDSDDDDSRTKGNRKNAPLPAKRSSQVHTCALPQCRLTASKRCTQCSNVWYCTKTHQRVHWKVHKKSCGCDSSSSEDDGFDFGGYGGGHVPSWSDPSGPYGMSEDAIEELMCQGVKPYDDDAVNVLNFLYGDGY